MFRIPYRWLPRTFFANIRSMLYDLYYGIQNILKWLPIIWFDRDFDWAYLGTMMEFKLRNMASFFKEYGHHTNSDLDARRCLVCADILKRLNSDGCGWYWDNAQIRFGSTTKAADYAQKHSESDNKYLELLIGKFLNHWWD